MLVFLHITRLNLGYSFTSNLNDGCRIDSWDSEFVYIFFDDKEAFRRSYLYSDGTPLCGS
jgi:hypothetical protein